MRKRSVAADSAAAHADDLFRFRLDNQIDLRHPLAQLAQRMPWDGLEEALAPTLPPVLPVVAIRPCWCARVAQNTLTTVGDECRRYLPVIRQPEGAGGLEGFFRGSKAAGAATARFSSSHSPGDHRLGLQSAPFSPCTRLVRQ